MKLKTRNRLLAVLLAGTMIAGSLAGCGGGSADETPAETAPAETQPAETDKPAEEAPAETPAEEAPAANEDTPIVIGHDDVNEKFSPFFGESVPDEDVWLLTTVSLLGYDRKGEIV